MQDSCVLRLSSDVILCASFKTPQTTRFIERWKWKAKEMAIIIIHIQRILKCAAVAVKIHPIYDDTFMYAEQQNEIVRFSLFFSQ